MRETERKREKKIEKYVGLDVHALLRRDVLGGVRVACLVAVRLVIAASAGKDNNRHRRGCHAH